MIQRLSKRAIIITTVCFLAMFFIALSIIMAKSGKLDLTRIPVIGETLAEAITPEITVSKGGTVKNLSSVRPSSDYISPYGITISDDGIAYVGDETGMKVYKLNLANKEIVSTYTTNRKVNNVYINGGKVYVLEGELDGKLVILNSSMNKEAEISVGHTPQDMAIAGTTAYVANKFSNTVSVVNLNNKSVVKEIEVSREPVEVELAGSKLFVACHLPDDNALADVVSSKLNVINTSTNTLEKTIPLVNGAGNVKDMCVSPDGKTLYVSHVIGRYAYPTSQTDRGWIQTNGFSIIDAQKMEVTASLLLDEVELGAANPWGIEISEDGTKLVVSLSGTNEVMVVNVSEMNKKINAVKSGNGLVSEISRIVDYLPFLDGARTRISMPGQGPRMLAVKDGKAYICQYYSGNIAVLDLSSNTVTDTISLGSQPEMDSVRRGEYLWNNASDSYQKWLSCSSCHPYARSGAFNWDELNDGLGNEKNTKSLIFSHRTPPTMHTGISATAEIGVAGSFNYVISEEDLECINEFLRAQLPVPSPYLNKDGTLTESAIRGKQLFESKGCVSCHPAPLYTNMKLIDSTTRDPETDNWDDRPLDVPTLVETWRSAPYFFNGKKQTMVEAVKHFAPDLSDSQAQDLANFVLSIGIEGEKYGVEQLFYTDKNGVEGQTALVPGSTITSFTIRNQSKDAPRAKVIFELLDNSGNSLYRNEKSLGEFAYNTRVTVNITNGIKVSENLPKGSMFKISIVDASNGNPLATDYVLKY
ncbi:MAG TPA: hypothetical protein GXX17_06345 [Clostridiales bacterium]|nr:hypothetical protein [Clostridiales bacterium]